jgi:uncharacterized protein YbbC (DUF1343 family)/CubicO group peptidase (beta-lactamase class C family)
LLACSRAAIIPEVWRARAVGVALALGVAVALGLGACEPRTPTPLPPADAGPPRPSSVLAASARAPRPAETASDAGADAAVDGGAEPSAATPKAVPLAPETVARIDQVVEGCMTRGEVPGAVVEVVRGDAVVLRKAYGWRRTEPDRVPLDADTLFDLASLTKPIATASSVLLLVEQGKLALDAPVARYLPPFAARGKERITVAELLLHTSGLPADNRLSDYARGHDQALARIYDLAPEHKPGSERLYSDLGYIVLGELVAHVAGEPLDAFARKSLFEPLEMRSTTFLPGPELRARAAPTEKSEGRLLEGEVHDPRARALGGVAGHAGLFSAADDLGRFARMLLGRGQLAGRRVLGERTVALLTEPRSVAGGRYALGFAASLGGVSHTGFTGTYLWLDPARRLAVVALASRLYPEGKGSADRLRRELVQVVRDAPVPPSPMPGAVPVGSVGTGIDRLREQGFAPLRGRRVGLLTNHTGRSADGRRTIDLLAAEPSLSLVAIFTPEHGLSGSAEGKVGSQRDGPSGLPVYSLYGSHQRPTPAELAGIDTLVFDLQDAGCRFYTYETTLGYLLETAAAHKLHMVVLDRPNPIDGASVEGPLLDAGRESFVGYHRLPPRHGMTLGELARLFNDERKLGAELEVVPMRGWHRADRFEQTGLGWLPPSPNLRTPHEALLYPGIGLLEATNLSVGRGTDRPFEQIGAPWLDAAGLAAALNAAGLPGIRFAATQLTPSTSTYAGQRCPAVSFELTDPPSFRPVRTGITIALALRKRHPTEWRAQGLDVLLGNAEVLAAILRGDASERIEASWQAELAAFGVRRARYLLY